MFPRLADQTWPEWSINREGETFKNLIEDISKNVYSTTGETVPG
jgi:hypothetical protein